MDVNDNQRSELESPPAPSPSKKKGRVSRQKMQNKAEKPKRRKKVATNGNGNHVAVKEVLVSAETDVAVPEVEQEEIRPGFFSHLGVRKNGGSGASDLLPPPPPPPVTDEISLGEALGEVAVETEVSLPPSAQSVPIAPMPELPPELAKNANGVGSYHKPFWVTFGNIEAAFVSDVGQIRTNNEDNATALLGAVPAGDSNSELPFGYFAVADGMGGHDNGEDASLIAINTSVRGVLREFYHAVLDGRQPGSDGRHPSELLVDIIEEANVAIVQEALANNISMGTTLSCFVLVGGMAYIGHIGDSRIYGIDRESGQLVQLSQDHSVVARLVQTGHMTPQEAAESPQRSMLYRSMGQRPGTPADGDFIYLSDYSRLLLCSDGLWEMVADDAIEHFLKMDVSPADICRTLVDEANRAGGDDNVTVLVVKL